jgi:hypothetical protein
LRVFSSRGSSESGRYESEQRGCEDQGFHGLTPFYDTTCKCMRTRQKSTPY